MKAITIPSSSSPALDRTLQRNLRHKHDDNKYSSQSPTIYPSLMKLSSIQPSSSRPSSSQPSSSQPSSSQPSSSQPSSSQPAVRSKPTTTTIITESKKILTSATLRGLSDIDFDIQEQKHFKAALVMILTGVLPKVNESCVDITNYSKNTDENSPAVVWIVQTDIELRLSETSFSSMEDMSNSVDYTLRSAVTEGSFTVFLHQESQYYQG